MKVLVITGNKGGCCKTTVTANLAAALQENERVRGGVLVVDLDPQATLTFISGAEENHPGSFEITTGTAKAEQCIQSLDEYDIIAGSGELSALDRLMDRGEAGINAHKLKKALEPLKDKYEYILLDTPPHLGSLLALALTAADFVLIPSPPDSSCARGVTQVTNTIDQVKAGSNPKLKIIGVLVSRFNQRLILDKDIAEALDDLAQQLGTNPLKTRIRESVAIRESQAQAISVLKYASRSRVAGDFRALANELLDGWGAN